MAEVKSFEIAKREVWEAYKRVKANRGAAGVDGVTIVMFEQDLSKNLYRIWNRLASGSYFPPPVKRVDIPKGDGKTRPLGIPTVADRIAQMVVQRRLEPLLEPVFHANSYGARHMMPCALRATSAGAMTGYLIWTSRGSSTTSIMIS